MFDHSLGVEVGAVTHTLLRNECGSWMQDLMTIVDLKDNPKIKTHYLRLDVGVEVVILNQLIKRLDPIATINL